MLTEYLAWENSAYFATLPINLYNFLWLGILVCVSSHPLGYYVDGCPFPSFTKICFLSELSLMSGLPSLTPLELHIFLTLGHSHMFPLDSLSCVCPSACISVFLPPFLLPLHPFFPLSFLFLILWILNWHPYHPDVYRCYRSSSRE